MAEIENVVMEMEKEDVIDALRRYARPDTDGREVCIIKDMPGVPANQNKKVLLPMPLVLLSAADLLERGDNNNMAAEKLQFLTSEMNRLGFSSLYFGIMDEEIPSQDD